MEQINLDGIEKFVGKSYATIADDLLNSRRKILNKIINNRSVPDEGLDELTIEMFLMTIAGMDSNNGVNHIGIGEREGRVYSNIVKKRNFNLIHGMGRSGNVNELQPKAVGSSLLVQLTCALTQNLLHSIGMTFIKGLLVLPFATGMAITLSLLTLKSNKPSAKYVIWPRIDQKTCFKSMFTANLIPIVIQPILKGDELVTNTEEIVKQIELLGCDNILCVFSTTSTFAPRAYDDIKEISIICKKFKLSHVINNAYGIYCSKIIDMLNQSVKCGNVDIVISSTDKNFMVPVGGSLVYSPNQEVINQIKKNYPGRASLSPMLDLFITLLEMGKNKYKALIFERKTKYKKLKEMMTQIADKYSEKIIENPNNKISIVMTLQNICKGKNKNEITYLGSLFYTRQISGIRIIAPSESINFNEYKFTNYGSHCENYPYLPYCAFACAIGISDEEIENFGVKFTQVIDSYLKESNGKSNGLKENKINIEKSTKNMTEVSNKLNVKFEKLVISNVENITI